MNIEFTEASLLQQSYRASELRLQVVKNEDLLSPALEPSQPSLCSARTSF